MFEFSFVFLCVVVLFYICCFVGAMALTGFASGLLRVFLSLGLVEGLFRSCYDSINDILKPQEHRRDCFLVPKSHSCHLSPLFQHVFSSPLSIIFGCFWRRFFGRVLEVKIRPTLIIPSTSM